MQSQGLCPINSTLLQDSLCHLAPLCPTRQCCGENDMEGKAEGTEPLLASGLLSALVVIWKQSQPL